MAEYKIQRVTDHTYINSAGEVVEGKRVRVFLPGYDETHHINVPSLDQNLVQREADDLLAARVALDELG